MTPLKRVALIGNHLPRRCGIATFTGDLHAALTSARPALDVPVIAMTDSDQNYDYPSQVKASVRDNDLQSYRDAADVLNSAHVDVVSLQHEYGIFGGPAGGHVIELLSRLQMPLVTTLHTVLTKPSPEQRVVMQEILNLSSRVVVMSAKGHALLSSAHDVQSRKLEIIPHGIPDVPFREPEMAKAKLGFTARSVILTFGLLAPSKGIETVIDAMPAIITACPDAVYVVLGATHPNLVKTNGEHYRESLLQRAEDLGVADHVVFFNQFVEQSTLLDFISMSDVYVTPYLNEAQMTSGTLAYSFGLGKAVISTPYWHAQELLSDGRGIIVPFSDPDAMGREIANTLTNHAQRDAMRRRAYAESRSMTWHETAKRYLSCFETARGRIRPVPASVVARPSVRPKDVAVPELCTSHFLSLCDSTGLLQHSVYSVADRLHGYCVDDNARALLLSANLVRTGEAPLPDSLTSKFAAFVQHAWNPDTRRFRNFMSFDRRWLEPQGSEDSHGRTLWALAECARSDGQAARRKWAATLFMTALPAVGGFTSPRAWAFTLLGLNAYCTLAHHDFAADQLRNVLAQRLLAMLKYQQGLGIPWFEDSLSYDNARLSQALIEASAQTGVREQLDLGLKSLRWLMAQQTAPSGCFRPVGSDGFGKQSLEPEPFDQQPVEAAATISACVAASRFNGSGEWPMGALSAFRWFLGVNDLNTSLVDLNTGGCADGLHRDRRNENQGAESTLSYLLGLIEIRAFQRSLTDDRGRMVLTPILTTDMRSLAMKPKSGSRLATFQISQSTEPLSST